MTFDSVADLTPSQREMAESLPYPVWTAMPDGVVNYLSQEFYRYTGLHDVDLAAGGWLEGVHPEDRLATLTAWAETLATEQPHEIELRLYHAESANYRWHIVASRPYRDESGQIVRWYGNAIDIHDRKVAEEAVRKSKERLRNVFEHEPECVALISAGGILLDINPAGLRLAEADSAARLIGTTALHLAHPDDRAALQEAHRRTLLGDSVRTECRLVGLRGMVRQMEVVTAPLHGDDGTVDTILSVSRDITQQRRDAELRTLETRVLDAISAGVSLPEILHQIASDVDRWLPGVRSAILLVEGERLCLGAAPHLPESYCQFLDGLDIAEGAGFCGTSAWRQQQVIPTDILNDPLWAPIRDLAQRHNLRACWSTPVVDSRGIVLATFGVYSDCCKSPTSGEIEFINRIGQYVRVAIERTRQHEQLRESEARYRSIYDLVPVSIWEEDWAAVRSMVDEWKGRGIHDLPAYIENRPEYVQQMLQAIRVLNVNEITLEIFEATSKEELLASRGLVNSSRDALPEFRAGLLAFAEGQPGYSTAATLRTIRGNIRHVLLRMAFPSPQTRSGRVIVSIMDVTAQRQAEERFRFIAQATSDVIWEYNPADDTLWFSEGRRTLLGLPPGRIERGLDDLASHIHPEDRNRVIGGIQATLQNGNRWKDEYRLSNGDRRYLQIVNQGFVMRDQNGHPTRMIGSIVDVSGQKRLEEQLRQAQRLESIGKLTGGIAHDFNNLLTVILGNAEILSESLAGDPRLRMVAEMTASAAERGAELTSRLLAFARRQPLSPTITDINRQLAGMDRLLRRTLGEHVEISIVQKEGLWKTLVDVPQLEAAILNLCINARDAMPEGGKLTIETVNVQLDSFTPGDQEDVTPGPYVMVAVSDTGIGMDRATLERAFEPFFTTKEVGKGSGLGLSMVYGFVKQSRGHIRVYSEPGHGTTVKLYFPSAGRHEPIVETQQEEAPVAPGSETILLVEDDPLVRVHVTGLLKDLGYEVVTAVNGPEALAILQSNPGIDLLFTDFVMPGGMNGRQLADAASRLRPGLPILFTSGYAEQVILDQGHLQPGANLLQKPYHRQALAAALRKAMGTVRPPPSKRILPDSQTSSAADPSRSNHGPWAQPGA